MKHQKIHLITVTILLLLGISAMGITAQDGTINFISTQFNVIEEAEKARDILSGYEGGTINYIGSEEGPLIDLLRAEASSGSGVNDVVGALHGTFPVLASEDLLYDLTDVLAEIEASNDVDDAFVELGKMGTSDYQYYVPWMQASYIMAAHVDALEYLPEGADINALTWEQVAEWAANLQEATGAPQLGLPVAGLFHRFLQGALWPSFTGGMVSQFKSDAAADMLNWVASDLWPLVNPQSINYSFMNEPLLAGEVMVAWDHVARLKPAFDQAPENFVAFPSPAGPAGRGFMPVVAGLAVPFTTEDPDAAMDVIKYVLSPEVQAQVLTELGFYPVIDGVDMDNLPEGIAKQLAAVQAQSASDDAIVALLPIGLGSRGGEINEIFKNAFNRVVLEGQDAESVLAEEGATLQSLLTDTGAPCWAPDPAGEGVCQVN